MTLLSPKVVTFFLFSAIILTGLPLLAQTKTLIDKDANGKIEFSYFKNNTNSVTSYSVVLYFKNDQYIYKPEIDSISLENKIEVDTFIKDLKEGLTSIGNDLVKFNVVNSHYHLQKMAHVMKGDLISFSKSNSAVVSSNSKIEVRLLLDWLDGIHFGRD